jgi:hypothetical protein
VVAFAIEVGFAWLLVNQEFHLLALVGVAELDLLLLIRFIVELG